MKSKKRTENGLMTVTITVEQHALLSEIKKKTMLPIKAQLSKALELWAEKIRLEK